MVEIHTLQSSPFVQTNDRFQKLNLATLFINKANADRDTFLFKHQQEAVFGNNRSPAVLLKHIALHLIFGGSIYIGCKLPFTTWQGNLAIRECPVALLIARRYYLVSPSSVFSLSSKLLNCVVSSPANCYETLSVVLAEPGTPFINTRC